MPSGISKSASISETIFKMKPILKLFSNSSTVQIGKECYKQHSQTLLNNTLLVATSTSSEVQLSGVTNSSMSFIFNGVIRTGKGEMWVSNLERYPAQK